MHIHKYKQENGFLHTASFDHIRTESNLNVVVSDRVLTTDFSKTCGKGYITLLKNSS